MLNIISFSYIDCDDDEIELSDICDICNKPMDVWGVRVTFLDSPDVCGHIKCLNEKFGNENFNYEIYNGWK